jgi:hypothetical protein
MTPAGVFGAFLEQIALGMRRGTGAAVDKRGDTMTRLSGVTAEGEYLKIVVKKPSFLS